MSANVPPAAEPARQIIRDWLTAQNRSLRNLAQEAGIQPSVISRFLKGETSVDASSALKLYSVLQRSLSPLDRRNFIDTLGLQALAAAFSRDTLFTVDLNAPTYEVGSRLMVAGFDHFHQMRFEDAITLFRAAEEVWGRSSSQAAFAVCMIAQMHLNLGDYQQAQAAALWVQNTYGTVMDPATKAELCRIRHWVDYFQGHYAQSAHWLRERIEIAEEAGIAEQKNPHFLGRIYYDLGCQCSRPLQADELFQKAVACFDQSYQIHLRWGDEHNRAFDLFRKAQALARQRNWPDAQKLRTQARQMFTDHSIGGSIALLHFELEDARHLVEEGTIEVPMRRTEEILQGWARVKYPKGMADALQVLGDLACMQGKTEQALEILVARLCVYPYDHYPSNRQVWEDVHHLNQTLIRQQGRKRQQALLQQLQQSAQGHQGYFAYLDHIAADREADLARVINQLQSAFT